jgi:excisionase family DNA binding protein
VRVQFAFWGDFVLETITLKRHPALPNVLQGARYSALGQQILLQQQQTVSLFQVRLLSLREVGAALGGISVETVRRYVREGKLPCVRVGRKGWMRVPASAVRKLLEGATTNG